MRDLLLPFVNQNWTLTNWPQYYPHSCYVAIEQEFVQLCQQVPNVRSVWRIGEIGVPGISDMDFVVVLDESLDGAPIRQPFIFNLSKPGRYLLMHYPLLLNSNLFKNLYRLEPVFDLRHLAGESVKPADLTEREQHERAIISMANLFVQLQPRLLIRTLLSGHMNVRGTLCQIHTIKYMVSLYCQITQAKTTPWDDFVVEYAHFRQNWFAHETKPIEELKQYLVRALIIVYQLLAAYQDWFTANYPEINRDINIKFFPKLCAVASATGWDPYKSIQMTLESWKRFNHEVLYLPFACIKPLAAYINGKGPLSNHVSRYWIGNNLGSYPYIVPESALMSHVQTQNEHIRFLSSNGLLIPGASYRGLGLLPRDVVDHTPINQIRKLYYQYLKWNWALRWSGLEGSI